ncbi:MAG TPA: DUF1778 domain-containing protein [Terriglobales bacterium]|nr:DUF1778 domain-containing protein [Terriglobales bacterium]
MSEPLNGKHSSRMAGERTALLIRCSKEEADKIRAAAKRERRTVSGFVLFAVLSRIANQEKTRMYAPPRNFLKY